MMRLAIQFVLLCMVVRGEGLPLAFLPNAGQFNPAVRFAVQTPDVRAAFFADGASFQAGDAALRTRFVGARSETLVEVRRLFRGTRTSWSGTILRSGVLV